ncbi:DUF421 domain-containing protein [Tsuneonella sp. CC-YZS046]|uniref:DUF421 domain-containing protein n=1 Tax=Tsuneonella sp. CC-YZS046 TaxID=3042152 RepID=UPI002D7A2AEB|nr:DUF421 domain-containing protein [Tsuneonella sp. CC-YZS046]WRO66683.1 DUF421 domain-containing protein [Tsuneonella sp. CC-YZS046]
MDIVIRATILFAITFVLLRLLGKRELGQMAPFEVVMLVVIGDLIQQGVTHNDFSITGATLAIFTFAFWTVLLGWLAYAFPALRKLLEDEPRVIIRNGQLLKANLRRDRMTIEEVESEMRLAGIATVGEVDWAILEPNGKISFIGKQEFARSDQKDQPEPK